MKRAEAVRAMAAAGCLAALCAPLAAAGQNTPSYASATETIHGTITAITGKYTLTLADVRGFADSVTMRDGTAIDPSGASLQVGEAVRIVGHTDGKTFDADEIDTSAATDTPDESDAAGGAAYYAWPYGANALPAYTAPFGAGTLGGSGFTDGSGLYGGSDAYNGLGFYSGLGFYNGFGFFGGYGLCCYGPAIYYFTTSPAPHAGVTPVTGHFVPLPRSPTRHPQAPVQPSYGGSHSSSSSSAASSHSSAGRR